MDGWNTVDGPPGEEAFTPVYFGNEAKRRLTLPRLGVWSLSYVALIPKDIAAHAVFQ